ncbi:MAG: DUF389 domain-containing protein [Coleofasciculaceae cyanobacterium]
MPKASTDELERLSQELAADATLSLNYLVLTVSACIIATIGLMTNSAAVIIGAMIIAPLMMPLRGLALAALQTNAEMIGKSLKTIAVGTLVAVSMAWVIGRVVGLSASAFSNEILARTQPNLADLGVAIAAGAVSGFAKVRPQISDALAGTAIAVALMPPLCVVGITLSQGAWQASGGAFLLYFTNLLGITLACMLVFTWGGYYFEYRRVRWALRGVLVMTALLGVPLFVSLWVLLKRVELYSTIKELLQTETITVGQQTELIKMDVNWPLGGKIPTEVILTVQATEAVTPKQVRDIERFLSSRLRRRFKVVFRVSEFREVRGDQPEETLPKPTP